MDYIQIVLSSSSATESRLRMIIPSSSAVRAEKMYTALRTDCVFQTVNLWASRKARTVDDAHFKVGEAHFKVLE